MPSDWDLDRLGNPSAPGAKQTDRFSEKKYQRKIKHSNSDIDFTNFFNLMFSNN